MYKGAKDIELSDEVLSLLSSAGTVFIAVQGLPGKSAYEIWLDAGHTGTEEDFLNWLRGESTNEECEFTPEEWEFTLEDGSIVTKTVAVKK